MPSGCEPRQIGDSARSCAFFVAICNSLLSRLIPSPLRCSSSLLHLGLGLQSLRSRVANLDAQLVALQSMGAGAGAGADGAGARRRGGKGGAAAAGDDSEDEDENGAGGRAQGFPLWQLLLIAVLMLGVGFALARTGLV